MRLVRQAGEDRGGVGEGVLIRIAESVGTPVYVYDAAHVRERYRRLTEALGARFPHHVHFAVKSNSNLAVLALLRSLGAGADIVSGGELMRVLRAGFAPERIVFSGVGKRADELDDALGAGVGLINIESAAEVDAVAAAGRRTGKAARVGVRVNPDVTADTHPYTATGERGVKFGVPIDEAVDLAVRIATLDGLELRSIGMHIGSQIADAEPYREGVEKLIGLIEAVRGEGVTTLVAADVGGGLAIRYTDEGRELDPDAFAAAVSPLAERTGLTVLVEPGRYLVGNAGTLVTRVLYRKRAGGREIAVVDAAMNDMIRPSLYRAVHDIRVLAPAGDPTANATVDVVGPICETGDFLGLDRALAGAEAGALLGVLGAGAYGFTMSSNYNSRPRAAEVVVDGARFAVVRERETLDDLIRGERLDPEWREA